VVLAWLDDFKNYQNVPNSQKVQTQAKDDEALVFHARSVAQARFIQSNEAQSRAARQLQTTTAWQDTLYPEVVEELP
jgi:hypothetical protein